MHIHWTARRNEELSVAFVQDFLAEMGANRANTVVSRNHRVNSGVVISTTDPVMGRRLLDVNEVRGRRIQVQDETRNHGLRCLIRCQTLRELTAAHIFQMLQTQGVMEVSKMGGRCGTFVLKMREEVVPFVWLGNTKMATYPYAPRPIRCGRCRGYGHIEPECQVVFTSGRRHLG